MKPNPFKWMHLTVFAGLSLVLLPSSHSQTLNVSGRYQCATAKVQGKSVPCSAAPLILKGDGHFELRGWEGNYLVSGEWVELSDSVVRSAPRSNQAIRLCFGIAGNTAGARWFTNGAWPT